MFEIQYEVLCFPLFPHLFRATELITHRHQMNPILYATAKLQVGNALDLNSSNT